MAEKKTMDKIGSWLFLLGVVIAVILGLAYPEQSAVAALLAVIGLIVGLLNITAAEVKEFLIASIALIVAAGGFGLLPAIGGLLSNILNYLIALVAPAAVVVALIAIWKLAKSK